MPNCWLLLAIPDVSTVTNKETRSNLNKLCQGMFDTILNDQGNTAVPVSTITEIVQEENEDYFFSLFNANADSSSSKGTSVERKQKALIIKRRKFQGGLHPGLIHGKSLYFFFIHLFIGLPALLRAMRNWILRLIDWFKGWINLSMTQCRTLHL